MENEIASWVNVAQYSFEYQQQQQQQNFHKRFLSFLIIALPGQIQSMFVTVYIILFLIVDNKQSGAKSIRQPNQREDLFSLPFSFEWQQMAHEISISLI